MNIEIENAIFNLIDILKLSPSIKKEVEPIINYLIQSDPQKRNHFEFSLRIRNGRIEKALRFIQYDEQSYSDIRLHQKRILLVEQILFLCLKNPYSLSKAIKLLNVIKKMQNFRLSIFIGIEKIPTDDLKLKLYFNFFKYINSRIPEIVLSEIFNEFEVKFKIKKRKFPEISFDLSDSYDKLNFKIYYLYKNLANSLNHKNFSSVEKDVFNYLRMYNPNRYFVITERYANNMCISEKIETEIRKDVKQINIIRKLLNLTNNCKIYGKIIKIMRNTQSRLHFVTVEKNMLTFYFR